MHFDHIPVIDLAALGPGSGPQAGRRVIAEQFDRACSEVGFAYIVNHGVPDGVTAAAFEASQRFHAQALQAKQKLAMNTFHRGYMGYATSTIVTSSVEKAVRPNQSESFMMMHELDNDDPEVLDGKPLAGPNQWPADLPGFRTAVRTYNNSLETLARRLLGIVELALDTPDLHRHFEKPTTFLRMLHYPPQPDAIDRQYGSAPHTDYGFITLLAQDDNGGLQVQNDAGEWIDAPPLANSLVVNIGDMTARWSNNRWRSTRHRVINRSNQDRYSIPFFFDPHMDTVVECLPACVSADRPAGYEPVCYGEYLMHRLDANYDYRADARH